MAAELSAGQLFADIVPRLKAGFGGAVEKELDGPLGRIRSKAMGIGKILAVGVGAGVVGGGALLMGAATTLDDAFDKIEIGVDGSSVRLDRMKEHFRNIARDVPDDMGKVADAMVAVHKRTGLVGTGLETLTKKELTLARITGEDLNGTIKSTTRLFGDWGIGVDEQGGHLDKLLRASKLTGVGIGELSDQMVKYGAPLRQLGFDFDTSAALIGKFEKEGVNTGLVMGSMRVALGKMAKAGEDPVETLGRVTDQIKNAGSAGEANALALELFGARAGPDMAAAIREGRFEVDGLVEQIQNGKDTIEGTAASTDDFAEKFAKLKNRAILAAEPLAGKLFDAINSIADAAAPVVGWIGRKMPVAFDAAKRAISPLVAGARQLFDVIFRGDFTGGGPFSEDSPIVDGAFRLRDLFIRTLLPAARSFFDWISDHGSTILKVAGGALLALLSPIGALVVGFVLAYNKSEKFREILAAVAGWLVDKIPAGLAAVRDALAPVVAGIVDFVKNNPGPVLGALAAVIGTLLVGAFVAWASAALGAAVATVAAALPLVLLVAGIALLVGGLIYAYQHFEGFRNIVDSVAAFLVDVAWPKVQQFAGWIADKFGELVGWVRDHWDEISSAISTVVDGIVLYVSGIISTIVRLWDNMGGSILGLAKAAWSLIRSTVENGINLVRGVIEFVLALINGDWGKAWDALKGIVSTVLDQLGAIVSFGLSAVKNVITGILGLLKTAWETAWTGLKDFVGDLWHGLGDGLKGVLNGILRGIGGALNFAIDLLNDALDAIDSAAGPWVNFGEIPHVKLPQLATGGTAVRSGLAVVGDGGNGSGAELAALPKGASIVPLDVARMIAGAALEGAGAGGDGVTFEEGAIQVDASGIQDTATVGRLVSEHIAFKVNRGRRSRR